MNNREMFTIWDLFDKGGQDPDHNAIEAPGYLPLTYCELRVQIEYVVKALNTLGYHRNDRIAVIIPAGPDAAVCIISVMAGFTVVPLNPLSKGMEYDEIFSRLGIKALIVQKDYQTSAMNVATLRNIPIIELVAGSGKAGIFKLLPAGVKEVSEPEYATPSDIAYVLLTSGTTSMSKIVPVSQKQSAISKQRTAVASEITGSDRCLHIVPYYHGMGVGSALLAPLIAGGTVICTRDFIPSDFFDLLKTYRPTYYTAGPALHAGILRAMKKRSSDELKNSSLRYIRTGSGFLPANVGQELESLFNVPVIEAYGMSEAGTISINLPPKRGSVGIPFVDSIKIIDQNGLQVGPYIPGEIVIKGEMVFNGYEDAPDANNNAFIDGWFRTGDIGYLDEAGYLFLTGRIKEIINKGGEKISPEEIDIILRSHHGVREAMTFPVHDPVLGEDIAAMVVPAQDNITEAELRVYLLDRLIHSKIPRKIYFVDEIPRNPVGKPLRHVGTQRYSRMRSDNTP